MMKVESETASENNVDHEDNNSKTDPLLNVTEELLTISHISSFNFKCYNLTKITEINAQSSSINTFPEEILQITQLEHLNLSDNQINQLPNEIANLKYLKVLNIASNCLQELPALIGQLFGLQELDASQNQLSTVPISIFQLQHLSKVNLSHNCLKNIPPGVTSIQKLIFLDVSFNKIENIDHPPVWLNTIQVLYIHNNLLEALPIWLNDATMLHSLNISFNTLHKLPSKISRNAMSDCTPCTLRLKLLDIQNCGITSTLPPPLLYLQELASLKIGNTPASSNVTKHFNKSNSESNFNALTEFSEDMISVLGPKLKVLDAQNMQLCGLPKGLSSLTNLKVLLLKNNPVMWLPHSFDQLVNLETCNLSQCQLLYLPDCLSKMKIKHFDLSYNKIDGIPTSLGALVHLEYLDLYSNKLEDVPDFIMQLPALVALDVGYNKFLAQDKFQKDVYDKYEEKKINLRQMHNITHRVDVLKPSEAYYSNFVSGLSGYSSDSDHFEDCTEEFETELREDRLAENLLKVELNSPETDSTAAYVIENWDESEEDSDDNFDPNNVCHRNFNKSSLTVESIKEKYKEHFFCPGDNHAHSVKKYKIVIDPEPGQFDDVED